MQACSPLLGERLSNFPIIAPRCFLQACSSDAINHVIMLQKSRDMQCVDSMSTTCFYFAGFPNKQTCCRGLGYLDNLDDQYHRPNKPWG